MRIVMKIGAVIVASAVAAACMNCRSLSVAAEKTQVVHSSKSNEEGKIALTFDDGPNVRYTEEILDILDGFGITATFFMIGENISRFPDLAREVSARGHEIGNHTYTHLYMNSTDKEVMKEELVRTDYLVKSICGCGTKLIRPPGGLYGEAAVACAEELGSSLILWTLDTRDWAHTPSDEIAEYVLGNIKSGDIILMHDHVSGKSPTPDALRIIIPELLKTGYTFVSVSELLAAK